MKNIKINNMKQKIYLSGGFKSGWMEKTIELIDGFDYIIPSMKEKGHKMNVNEYGTWDLHFIKQCDIFFAYMEKTNPSGFGLAVEIGFAKGIGKTVILVLEQGNEFNKDRYLEFLTKVADVTFSSYDEGAEYLRSFS